MHYMCETTLLWLFPTSGGVYGHAPSNNQMKKSQHWNLIIEIQMSTYLLYHKHLNHPGRNSLCIIAAFSWPSNNLNKLHDSTMEPYWGKINIPSARYLAPSLKLQTLHTNQQNKCSSPAFQGWINTSSATIFIRITITFIGQVFYM